MKLRVRVDLGIMTLKEYLLSTYIQNKSLSPIHFSFWPGVPHYRGYSQSTLNPAEKGKKSFSEICQIPTTFFIIHFLKPLWVGLLLNQL